MTTLEGYLTYEDISLRVGVPVSTLYVWRARGKLPEPDVMFRQPLWKQKTIDDWSSNESVSGD